MTAVATPLIASTVASQQQPQQQQQQPQHHVTRRTLDLQCVPLLLSPTLSLPSTPLPYSPVLEAPPTTASAAPATPAPDASLASRQQPTKRKHDELYVFSSIPSPLATAIESQPPKRARLASTFESSILANMRALLLGKYSVPRSELQHYITKYGGLVVRNTSRLVRCRPRPPLLFVHRALSNILCNATGDPPHLGSRDLHARDRAVQQVQPRA